MCTHCHPPAPTSIQTKLWPRENASTISRQQWFIQICDSLQPSPLHWQIRKEHYGVPIIQSYLGILILRLCNNLAVSNIMGAYTICQLASYVATLRKESSSVRKGFSELMWYIEWIASFGHSISMALAVVLTVFLSSSA